MKLKETFVKGDLVYDGKLLKVHRDSVRMPDGHQEIREVIRHTGAAVIVPEVSEKKYVLVRQYRYAVGSDLLEFPAGRLEPGEAPERCAIRELQEETGYRAGKLELLFRMHPAPGYSDEMLWIYKATELEAGVADPDPDELVYTTIMTLEELSEKFTEGEITDSKTASAILFLINENFRANRS